MSKLKNMDLIFYITILSGLVTVSLSAITYYQAKQKEKEADEVSKTLVTRTNEVVLLQERLLNQVIGKGIPTLFAHFYPDKKIALYIANENDTPIYDVSINFPDPDPTELVKNAAKESRNLTWDEMRNQWTYVDAFNLSPGSNYNFYNFHLSDQRQQTSCFLNITTRNGVFSGIIVIEKQGDSLIYKSEIRDSSGKIFNEKHG